jgi:hypothetical protein
VYVDLTWPMVAPDVVAPRSAPAAASAAAAPAQAPVSRVVPVVDKRQESEPAGNYDEQLRPLLERLGAAKPFLTSAARSGSPDVLRALDENLSTIESSLRSLRAPSASLDQHQMLLSAIQTARRATDPSYSGDRTVQAREAFVRSTSAAQ